MEINLQLMSNFQIDLISIPDSNLKAWQDGTKLCELKKLLMQVHLDSSLSTSCYHIAFSKKLLPTSLSSQACVAHPTLTEWC